MPININSIKVLYLTGPSAFTYKKMELIRRGLRKRSPFDSAMASMKEYSIEVDYLAPKSWGRLNEIALALKALILRGNYDVIFTGKGPGLFLALMRSLLRWKKPRLLVLIERVRTNSIFDYFARPIIHSCVNNVDKILCLSSLQRETHAMELKISKNRIVAIPYGIDTKFFKPEKTSTENFILCVGDACRDDETLLEAVRNLPINLIRVSDEFKIMETFKKQLKVGSRYSNLKEKVTLLHRVSDIQLKKLYAKSKIVVVPIQRHSNQPAGLTALLEAMAMGKAIIITRGLATEDYVINGETGIIINPGDVDQLKNAILWLLGDDLKRKILGNNARKSVEENFTLYRFTEKLANLLQSICNKN